MRVVTLGTFDLFHVGHVNLLRGAARYGDELYVGVNSDRFVEQYKGQPPVVGEQDRLAVVQSVKGVTFAQLNDSAGREFIEWCKPQVIAIGSDWHRRDYLEQIDVEQRWLEQNRIALVYLPYTPGVSTTQLRRRIAA